MLPANIAISEKQATDLANHIRINGTSLLKHGRDLFLWQNLINSTLVLNIDKSTLFSLVIEPF